MESLWSLEVRTMREVDDPLNLGHKRTLLSLDVFPWPKTTETRLNTIIKFFILIGYEINALIDPGSKELQLLFVES